MIKKTLRAIVLLACTPMIFIVAGIGWLFDDNVPVIRVWWSCITFQDIKWDI